MVKLSTQFVLLMVLLIIEKGKIVLNHLVIKSAVRLLGSILLRGGRHCCKYLCRQSGDYFIITPLTSSGSSINCYSCTSTNHSQPHCEDPVAPYHIKYTKNCQVPKEGHLGQFPANFCVKLIGTNGT